VGTKVCPGCEEEKGTDEFEEECAFCRTKRYCSDCLGIHDNKLCCPKCEDRMFKKQGALR